MIYPFNNKQPRLNGERIFVAPGADLIGDVTLQEDSSIWFNATLRGDLESITVGEGSNVQDGSTVHTDRGFPVEIGRNVTIGHNCIIHGCTIGDGSLIGMGAVVLTGARIGKNCLIAAGSLVTGKTEVPDGTMAMGSPAKVVKSLKEGVIARNLKNSAYYVTNKDAYLDQGLGQPDIERSK